MTIFNGAVGALTFGVYWAIVSDRMIKERNTQMNTKYNSVKYLDGTTYSNI